MNTISEIESALKGVVANHGLLEHEFLTSKVARDRKSLAVWAGQQYFMSISLSQCFAALYVRSPIYDWRLRLTPLTLAIEEAWGGSPNNHGSAFLEFYKSIGGDSTQLESVVPLPETAAAAEGRLRLSQGLFGHDLPSSTLALAYANEYANLFIFRKLRRVVSLAVGDRFNKDYFDSHVRDEAGHSQALVKFAMSGLAGFDLAAAKAATNILLDLRAGFFDGILRAIESTGSRTAAVGASVAALT